MIAAAIRATDVIAANSLIVRPFLPTVGRAPELLLDRADDGGDDAARPLAWSVMIIPPPARSSAAVVRDSPPARATPRRASVSHKTTFAYIN